MEGARCQFSLAMPQDSAARPAPAKIAANLNQIAGADFTGHQRIAGKKVP
jgi:hypothetical protein